MTSLFFRQNLCRAAAAGGLVALLSGCLAPMTPPSAGWSQRQAPAAAAPRPGANPAAMSATTLPGTPDAAPQPVAVAPAAPRYSGGVDARTGLRQGAVVALTGDRATGFNLLFRPDRTEPASVEAAPARLCGSTGVASSRKNTPGAGSAMPGVQIMIVKCGAA